MKNPFVYGEVVTGEDFTNRKDEVKELTRDLKDCEKIFLISPRRYGKTSLIINVLVELKRKRIYPIYIGFIGYISFIGWKRNGRENKEKENSEIL